MTLLIAPEGIEIPFNRYTSRLASSLLIAPEGIEIKFLVCHVIEKSHS
jgi:hypothetical protein